MKGMNGMNRGSSRKILSTIKVQPDVIRITGMKTGRYGSIRAAIAAVYLLSSSNMMR